MNGRQYSAPDPELEIRGGGVGGGAVFKKKNFGPGTRFSKVPINNGPGEVLPFTLKIEVSIVLQLA